MKFHGRAEEGRWRNHATLTLSREICDMDTVLGVPLFERRHFELIKQPNRASPRSVYERTSLFINTYNVQHPSMRKWMIVKTEVKYNTPGQTKVRYSKSGEYF